MFSVQTSGKIQNSRGDLIVGFSVCYGWGANAMAEVCPLLDGLKVRIRWNLSRVEIQILCKLVEWILPSSLGCKGGLRENLMPVKRFGSLG